VRTHENTLSCYININKAFLVHGGLGSCVVGRLGT
ncbi:MAG: hypothetical protein ACI856_002807, partial [Kiritimatiellia bacterium]